MSTKRWAIMVPFEDQWLYVVDVNNAVQAGEVNRYQPLTYDTAEAAHAVAAIWSTYQVVEYEPTVDT